MFHLRDWLRFWKAIQTVSCFQMSGLPVKSGCKAAAFLIQNFALHYFPSGGLGLFGEVVPGEFGEVGEVELGGGLVGGVVVIEPGEVVVGPGGGVVLGEVVEPGKVVEPGEVVVEGVMPPGRQGFVAEMLLVPVGKLLLDELAELDGRPPGLFAVVVLAFAVLFDAVLVIGVEPA